MKNARFRFERRRQRVRAGIKANSDRPRLVVVKTSQYLYAQIVDDNQGRTVASICSKNINSETKSKTNIQTASILGKEIAKKAVDLGIKDVVFDRSGNKYHGRIKAVADSAREAGLNF